MPSYERLIKNVRVVRPEPGEPFAADIAIAQGRIAAIAPGLDADLAARVDDGQGLLAFPGVVDAHMHTGIYAPLAEDALSESRAAAAGGVTTSLNYMRTGRYYLNKGGPYRDFFPEVLRQSAGRFHVDYGYHLAPMSAGHIEEIEELIEEHGVSSFKIFMFYGSHGLHGRSDDQSDFLMLGPGERYDLAHFEFVMRGIRRAMDRLPHKADRISLSLHCETAEIMRAYTEKVEAEGRLQGLAAYHAARPPHSEGLAVCIAAYLAHETGCPNVNLLHLSSRKAVEAALAMAEAFPHVDFRREVTIGHLMLDVDAPSGNLAKVNPPIRPREDKEYLWEQLAAGRLDWVVSDHACCRHEQKLDPGRPGDVWLARAGFGGTEYLLPALVGEGPRRGLALHRIAALTSRNPAQRFGLSRKGDLAVGYDADIALVDPARSLTVRAEDSPSGQGYSPFEGLELGARVARTYLRGEPVYDGAILGPPRGRYLKRPC